MTTSERVRRTEILDQLTAGDPHTPLVERVCEVSAGLLGVTGAGMCVVGGRRQQIIVHGTDPLIEDLEDMQVTLGQGPCIQAVRVGAPVLVPDLEGHRTPSWQTFADQAYDRGVRAVFAFPLHAGSHQLGALDLYRTTPGALSSQQHADALVLTELATRAILAQKDKTYLNGSVSALHWLTTENSSTVVGSRGRAVDLGVTVQQALAAHWPDRTAADRATGRDRDELV